jgi:hypothetical protein
MFLQARQGSVLQALDAGRLPACSCTAGHSVSRCSSAPVLLFHTTSCLNLMFYLEETCDEQATSPGQFPSHSPHPPHVQLLQAGTVCECVTEHPY